MIELEVYSTVVGELPKLVERKEARCFVPYEQSLKLLEEIEELKCELKENNK